jgi:hypothetical protein
MTKVTKKLIVGIIYLILSIACFLLVWKMTSNYDSFLKDAQSTQGKVISVEDVYDDLNYRVGYRPVIEFQTNNGVKIISNEHFVANIRNSRGASRYRYNIGDNVGVWYHEKNPQKIMLVDRGDLDTQQASTIGVLGFIFLGCGIYTFRSARKQVK